MNKSRPLNINPLSIKLPLGAWVSISHRIAGVLVFLLIPLLMWGWQQSLHSPEGFEKVKASFYSPFCKATLWLLMVAFIFHFLAGIRHLLMDIHVGDSRAMGRLSAGLVFAGTILIGLIAYYCWG